MEVTTLENILATLFPPDERKSQRSEAIKNENTSSIQLALTEITTEEIAVAVQKMSAKFTVSDPDGIPGKAI